MFRRGSSRETKVLVNDPTDVLVNAIGLLQHDIRKAPGSLWDEVTILHYLFKLMRSQDGRKRAPDWSRGPFGVQAWDETMRALGGHEEVRQKQDWLRKYLAILEHPPGRGKETDKEKITQSELYETLDYFIPFFNNYRVSLRFLFQVAQVLKSIFDQDSSDSKRAFSTQNDICYPSYPGYPSVYPRYTFVPRSAFHVGSRR